MITHFWKIRGSCESETFFEWDKHLVTNDSRNSIQNLEMNAFKNALEMYS